MKKLSILYFFGPLLILSLALFIFSGPAQAYVYDDFTGAGINTSLWYDAGPNYGLFSQPGGKHLQFIDPSGEQTDKLRSYDPVSGAFFVSMSYSYFTPGANANPGGEFKSTSVELALSDGTNSVNVNENYNADGYFFQAVLNLGGYKTNLQIPAPSASGVSEAWLGIYYNGLLGSKGVVTFYYETGSSWTPIITSGPVCPDFSSQPYFAIVGDDAYGSSLSFTVDQVDLAVPLPPSLFMLGSGLLGLGALGWRGKQG